MRSSAELLEIWNDLMGLASRVHQMVYVDELKRIGEKAQCHGVKATIQAIHLREGMLTYDLLDESGQMLYAVAPKSCMFE